MVEAAKNKKGAEPPPRLQFAWWCEKYHRLPGPGDILDQEYREMYLNDMLPSIYLAVAHWRTHAGIGMSKADNSIIMWLVKNGLMNRRT